jgi:hypothetical protein
MIQRKALTINNGAAIKRTKSFNQSRALSLPKQQKQETSVFVHARAGRNSVVGASSGSTRVGK